MNVAAGGGILSLLCSRLAHDDSRWSTWSAAVKRLLTVILCEHVLCCVELDIADRRQKREIRHLEQELPKWQVLVDSVTGRHHSLLSTCHSLHCIQGVLQRQPHRHSGLANLPSVGTVS